MFITQKYQNNLSTVLSSNPHRFFAMFFRQPVRSEWMKINPAGNEISRSTFAETGCGLPGAQDPGGVLSRLLYRWLETSQVHTPEQMAAMTCMVIYRTAPPPPSNLTGLNDL
jgi:hypothetical protein